MNNSKTGPLLKVRPSSAAREHEVTDEAYFLRRREFLKSGLIAASTIAVGSQLLGCGGVNSEVEASEKPVAPDLTELSFSKSKYKVDEPLSEYADATSYNNFYEFGTDKSDPARNAHTLKPRPWSIKIEGEIKSPGTFDLDDLLKPHPLEERIYRLRCVEAWSMVIPWIGFPLGDLLRRLEPTGLARYVAFRTLNDATQMPGQKRAVLNWPYREGLRLDEAMNPLTLLAVGMYGKVLPNQNGAPLRLVVPWKYGFKSIKSIVSIELTKDQPRTSWNQSAPAEYGFYSNVNPEVDHPRWTQASERRAGEFRRRPTLMFNGYAEEVGSLYAGLDLKKNF